MASEIRIDQLNNSVIISTRRSKRPKLTSAKKSGKPRKKECPFCPGNEKMTPPSVFSIPKKKDWKVRIFPNKFGITGGKRKQSKKEMMYKSVPASGFHEVLVETPKHGIDYNTMSLEQTGMVIRALKQRYSELSKKKGIKYVALFKNYGKEAGASIAHSHMQIIASSMFPSDVADSIEKQKAYFKKNGRCALCDVIKHETKTRKRLVMENRSWVCFCPYVSIWPYQISVCPKRRFSDISQLSEGEVADLAECLKRIFTSLYRLFPKINYNILYCNFPKSEFSHFLIKIYPRLKTNAGFEFFGYNVNTKLPEEAADELKKALQKK